MKAKFVNESFFDKDTPDWQSGIEFGKRRDDVSNAAEYTGISATKQKKLDALDKKEAKIMAKWKENRFLEVSVRKRVMSKIEKVRAKEALDLIDTAKSNIRRMGDANGIIIYI